MNFFCTFSFKNGFWFPISIREGMPEGMPGVPEAKNKKQKKQQLFSTERFFD